MVRTRLTALATMLGVLGTAAHAADIPTRGVVPQETAALGWFVHLGPAGIILDESADMYAGGYRLAGADISIKSQLTFAVEAGYFLHPNVAVSFTGGLPPFAKIEAAGTMNGVGRIGATTYGPMTVTIHYHLTDLGRVQPYIGFGPAFMYVFDEKDGVMSELNIKNTVGIALQVGADFMVTERWGMFVDVKKAILRTEAEGAYGPAPIRADVKLDPLVLHTGLTFRF